MSDANQTFSDPKERASLHEQIQAAGLRGEIIVSDFDIVSTYYVKDRNSLFAMQGDPAWRDGPGKIQAPWVAMEPGLFVVGQEEQYSLK